MESLETFGRVQTIIAELWRIELIQIKLESDLMEDLKADSLDVVELIIAIEAEFEIEDFDDSTASQIATVRDLVNYIDGRWDLINKI